MHWLVDNILICYCFADRYSSSEWLPLSSEWSIRQGWYTHPRLVWLSVCGAGFIFIWAAAYTELAHWRREWVWIWCWGASVRSAIIYKQNLLLIYYHITNNILLYAHYDHKYPTKIKLQSSTIFQLYSLINYGMMHIDCNCWPVSTWNVFNLNMIQL